MQHLILSSLSYSPLIINKAIILILYALLFTDVDIVTSDNSVDVAVPVVLTLFFTLIGRSV